MTSPFHWQPPPLPTAFAPQQTAKCHAEPNKIWHRLTWGGEASLAQLNLMLPSFADIILSCQVKVLSGRPVTMKAVREAMRQLRFEHPVVACRITYGKPDASQPISGPEARLIYVAPTSEADIEDWLDEIVVDETDALVEAGGNVADAVAHVRREIGKLQKAYIPSQLDVHCIPASERSEGAIVLRLSHVLYDGLGAFEFMNKIVGQISRTLGADGQMPKELPWDEELKRLVEPTVEYARVPWTSEETGQDAIMPQKLFDVMTRQSRATIPTLYTPFPNAPSTYTGTIHRSLSEDEVVKLVSTARAHECTFFTTAFAATALATLSVNPPSTQENLAAFQILTPISLRYKGILTRDEGLPSAVGFCVLASENLGRFLRSSPNRSVALEDIWVLAKEISAQVKEQSREMHTIALWSERMRETLSRPIANAPSSAEAKPPAVPTPVISSMGVVDSYLSPRHGTPGVNEIELSELWMTARNCYTGMAGATTHIFTWQKKLHMSISYPEALLGSPDEQAEAMKRGDAESSGSLLAWADKYIEILKRISVE